MIDNNNDDNNNNNNNNDNTATTWLKQRASGSFICWHHFHAFSFFLWILPRAFLRLNFPALVTLSTTEAGPGALQWVVPEGDYAARRLTTLLPWKYSDEKEPCHLEGGVTLDKAAPLCLRDANHSSLRVSSLQNLMWLLKEHYFTDGHLLPDHRTPARPPASPLPPQCRYYNITLYYNTGEVNTWWQQWWWWWW